MTTYVIDNFNDNVIDTSRIIVNGEPAITETGGKLVTPATNNNGYTTLCYSRTLYDLTKGRLCVQISKSGANDPDVYTYFGVRDANGRVFTMNAKTNDATLWFSNDQLGSSISMTNNDTTVGIGPSWNNSHYLGYSYVDSTRTFTISRSSDLSTWTAVRTIVITGPLFDFRRVGMYMGASNYRTTASSYVASWDNLTYISTDSTMRVKVRFGGAWVPASVKIRTASNTWVKPIPRARKNSDWWMPQA